MKYKGSCHCGAVAFEVEGEIEAAVACNCSICARKGALLWAAPRESLHVTAAEDTMSSYSFNRQAIVHRFCRTCGLCLRGRCRRSRGALGLHQPALP